MKETRSQKDNLTRKEKEMSEQLAPIKQFLQKYHENLAARKEEAERVEVDLKNVRFSQVTFFFKCHVQRLFKGKNLPLTVLWRLSFDLTLLL